MSSPQGGAQDPQAWSAHAVLSCAPDLQPYIGRQVVLDTAGPLVYIGTLTAVGQSGLWLEHADLHDCRDGHANKEAYVFEAREAGVRTNRRRIFVLHSAIMSVSALSEVITEDLGTGTDDRS